MLLPNTPPLLSSCCFLPFCPSPYHSPDPYQEEKETPMETNTYFKAAFQAALPNNILSAEILLVFFSSKDMQFARVILLRTRFVIVQDIQVKKLIAKFVLSRYFIFISIVIVKEWLLYFSLCLIGRGEILHRPFLCTNLLG